MTDHTTTPTDGINLVPLGVLPHVRNVSDQALQGIRRFVADASGWRIGDSLTLTGDGFSFALPTAFAGRVAAALVASDGIEAAEASIEDGAAILTARWAR